MHYLKMSPGECFGIIILPQYRVKKNKKKFETKYMYK